MVCFLASISHGRRRNATADEEGSGARRSGRKINMVRYSSLGINTSASQNALHSSVRAQDGIVDRAGSIISRFLHLPIFRLFILESTKPKPLMRPRQKSIAPQFLLCLIRSFGRSRVNLKTQSCSNACRSAGAHDSHK